MTRALVVMASGLGKTYTAAFDARAFEKERRQVGRILYLSHQHVILDQAKETFINVLGSRIYGRFDGEVHDHHADIVFGTFQSVSKSLGSFDPHRFDYIVVDEAHHTAAPTRDAVVAYFRPRFLLGLTATPNRADGQDIFEYYNDTVAAYLPLERAVAEGLLSAIEYRVVWDLIDPDVLREILAEIPTKSLHQHFRPRLEAEIRDTVLRESSALFPAPKVIIFCQNLPQMHHFAPLFPKSGTISGKDSRDAQLQTIKQFSKGGIQVLLARDVLNEGVDVPDANTLVFLRNTASPVVFLQQLGRGLRKGKNKDRVLVLDFVDNIDHFDFVYSLLSKIEAEQRRLGSSNAEIRSSLVLDQTAKDIISELIRRKEEREIIFELATIHGALNFRLGLATLRNMVKLGYLIPDISFTEQSGAQRHYLEQASMRRFMRQLHSPVIPDELVNERAYAKFLGKSVAWLRLQERTGRLPATWAHILGSGRVEFYYQP